MVIRPVERIADPAGKKSVVFTGQGLRKSEQLLNTQFGKSHEG